MNTQLPSERIYQRIMRDGKHCEANEIIAILDEHQALITAQSEEIKQLKEKNEAHS